MTIFPKFFKHTGNNAVDGMKKTIKKGMIFKKIFSEMFINGKDAMPMTAIKQLESHIGGTFHGVFIATCRTEPAMTSKRNKFGGSTFWTGIFGTTE